MSENKPVEVLSTIDLSEAQQEYIKNKVKNIHLTVVNAKDAANLPKEIWEKAEVLLTSGRNLPTREQAPALKWIQVSFAGVEHALEYPISSAAGIMLTSASGVRVSQLGEYALMALLALSHKLPKAIQAQHEKKWLPNYGDALMPQELRESTVGIVGYGSIGREVARLLYAFGATVLAAKRNVMQPEDNGYNAQGLGDPKGNYFRRLYPIEGLPGMLKECDFVVLTLPLTKETYHLFSDKMFEAMKPGAGFVNIARGGLVDEVALVAALKSGRVGGAVLDVFEQEPLPPESPLWSLPNVIITPHVSGISPKLMDAVVDLFVENLQRYQAGEPLYNLVDTSKGY